MSNISEEKGKNMIEEDSVLRPPFKAEIKVLFDRQEKTEQDIGDKAGSYLAEIKIKIDKCEIGTYKHMELIAQKVATSMKKLTDLRNHKKELNNITVRRLKEHSITITEESKDLVKSLSKMLESDTVVATIGKTVTKLNQLVKEQLEVEWMLMKMGETE